ncbi:DNA repair protein NreA [Halorientalis sp.]|uniref:DNA repair protein NreA n=1 Tax=Halorientalis sp. TaxID=1931229 RepID=UPI00262DF6E7|nr:DNA repair protein NreA [Halorientalis sp.]
MRLDEFIEGFQRDETADLRRLAEEKSYAITEYLDDVERQLEESLQGGALFGSTAPSIFVGRSNYPDVSTGLLSPVVGSEIDPSDYVTSGEWYQRGYSIDDVFRRRTGLLNSTRAANVDVEDVWDGFVGVQREVAIADEPVDVEIGLDGRPELDVDVGDIGAPRGPRARARDAELTENPSVPLEVERTLEDDDWRADGAMTYLYRRGFDVYEINKILSAGALGQGANRRLVPTRWSITAVDDTVGQYLRGTIRNANSIDTTEVRVNEYMGNAYWVIMTPGQWEFELVELKAPGSVWNPDPDAGMYMAADSEGYDGRTDYVDETSGAYYATRLGVLEHLHDRGRQAKVLVVRHASPEYWAPVGVWQIREGVRHAFERAVGEAESFRDALTELAPHFPVSLGQLRRKSGMVSGLQAQITDF